MGFLRKVGKSDFFGGGPSQFPSAQGSKSSMLSFQCLWVRARCGHESRRDSFQQTKGPVRMLGWEDNATKDAIFAKHSKGIFGIYCRYTCINIHKYKYNIYIYVCSWTTSFSQVFHSFAFLRVSLIMTKKMGWFTRKVKADFNNNQPSPQAMMAKSEVT